MSLQSIGDLAQSFLIRSRTAQVKSELEHHNTQLSTGRVADVSRTLKGDFTSLAAVEQGSARAKAFSEVIRETAIHVGGMQDRLAAITEDGARVASQLATALDGAPPGIVNAVASVGAGAFDSAVSNLNARVAGRALFAGTASGGPALASGADILEALSADTATAQTPADLEAAVIEWFNDPGGGFDTHAYRGSGTSVGPISLSGSDNVTVTASAASPEMRRHLAGLALAALVDGGAFTGATRERAETLRRAGNNLAESQPGIVAMSANLGAVEARIDTIQVRNTAEGAALETARESLIGVDPFDAAVRLEQARSRVEMMFALTARLGRLNLSEHLR